MNYYRTKEEVRKLAQEIPNFSHRSELAGHVAFKHSLQKLGVFHSVVKDGFWVGAGTSDQKTNQFKASPDVLDFFVESGVLEDVVSRGALVGIYGRMSGGKIVETAALCYQSLVDPADCR